LTKSIRGGQEPKLILHRPVRVKLCQGVGHPPQCTTAGSEQRLVPLCTGVYLGKEGEQGAPYSSLTIHIVPPLACMGLGITSILIAQMLNRMGSKAIPQKDNLKSHMGRSIFGWRITKTDKDCAQHILKTIAKGTSAGTPQ
jgi:hypothetical protein